MCARQCGGGGGLVDARFRDLAQPERFIYSWANPAHSVIMMRSFLCLPTLVFCDPIERVMEQSASSFIPLFFFLLCVVEGGRPMMAKYFLFCLSAELGAAYWPVCCVCVFFFFHPFHALTGSVSKHLFVPLAPLFPEYIEKFQTIPSGALYL